MAKLLSSLPSGTKVKDTLTTYNGKPILFTIMEHNHAGDPGNSTALVTSNIITLKCFDAIEAGNSDSNRKQYGNNRYLYSNIKQWLNSEKAAGEWYVAQHSMDAAPTNSNVWSNYNEYDKETGFLANFSEQMKAKLLTTTKRVAKNTITDGGGYEDVTQKVFLLSNTEVGLANENSVAEGSIYELFNTSSNRLAYPTAEAVANSEYTDSNLASSKPWWWWLRTPYASDSYLARGVNTDGSLGSSYACYGNFGVRPACVVSSSILVSDEADTDGAYTIIWNAPPTITTDSDDLGDRNTHFSITFSINDADGDSVSARVILDSEDDILQEISSVILGREYTQAIASQKLSSLDEGNHVIKIEATDSNGNETVKSIAFKKVATTVTISGSDVNLGSVWTQIEYKFSFADSDGGAITLCEYIDGELARSIADAPQNVETTFDLSSWSDLEIEKEHTLKISCISSSGGEAERIIKFTKIADELSFEIRPMETDAPAEEILVKLNYEKTGSPTVKVEVTNAAFNFNDTAEDGNPEVTESSIPWEDATSEVLAGKSYEFTNGTFSSDRYGVAVKVTITKNENTERVYVTGLGIAFN